MIKKNKAEAIYLAINLILLVALAIFVPLKVRGIAAEGLLNFPAMAIFVALFVLLILLLRRERNGCLTLPILLIALLFAYDSVAPEAWIDARGDWETAKVMSVMGLKDYHAPAANHIIADEDAQSRMEKYQSLLPFYPLEKRLQAEAKPTVELHNDRRMHHPPLYFFLLSLWMKLTDSITGLKIFSKIMYLIYALLIFKLVTISPPVTLASAGRCVDFSPLIGLQTSPFALKHLDTGTCRIQQPSAHTFAIITSASLLLASQSPKSDLPLGIITAWLMLAILTQGNKKGLLPSLYIGAIAALAVFTKFTALILAIPLIFLAFSWHGWKAPLYLIFMALPLTVTAFLLYQFYGYDLILNALTGRIIQDQWVAGNISAKEFLVQRVAFGSFRIGIPLLTAIPFAFIPHKQDRPIFAPNLNIPLAATTRTNTFSPHSQPSRRIDRSPHRSSLLALSICTATYCLLPLFLWGSSIDRHQIGFLPLAVPLIALGLSRLQKLKTPILWLMLFYNILFLFYSLLENTLEFQYLIF